MRCRDDPKRMNQNATTEQRFLVGVLQSTHVRKPTFLRLFASLRFIKCRSANVQHCLTLILTSVSVYLFPFLFVSNQARVSLVHVEPSSDVTKQLASPSAYFEQEKSVNEAQVSTRTLAALCDALPSNPSLSSITPLPICRLKTEKTDATVLS